MRRQDKYPDTEVFHYFNANPKNRITTDCVVRAICLATQKSYATVVMDLAKLQCETGYDDCDKPLIDRYLQMHGFLKQKQPKKPNGKKYTGGEFCKKVATKSGRYVANIGGHHVVAIVDRKVNDIWDSTDGCIGNYWVKY